MPDFGGLDEMRTALAVIVGVLVVAVVLIPLLFFGIELIIVGFVVLVGILGRGRLGRRWVVQATPVDDTDRSLQWRVAGWPRSGRLMDGVSTSLADGRDRAPAEAAELIPTRATCSVPIEEQTG